MFGDSFFEKLPPYLSRAEKERLAEDLKQFQGSNPNQISYDNFYLTSNCEYIMQSDFLQPLQAAIWDEINSNYETAYIPAVLLSNTCDLSKDNLRSINLKHALFAPVVQLSDYINTLKDAGKEDTQIQNFLITLKSQQFSNLIYLPPIKEKTETIGFVIFLDKVFYRPTNSLGTVFGNLQTSRISSLSNFGFHLFLLKIIYHFARLPEELENRSATFC